jgi:DNA repair protein RecN (Recombination protein N)
MLHKIHIQNYAIIDELEIVFSQKLNAITGETGAGKSIIVGALGLILGQRADTSVLVDKEKKCIVEGFFSAKTKTAVIQWLQQNDLDIEEELVIRREITAAGKSRAFINDTPVTLQQLNSLSSLLVDMHQQFDTLEIGESDFQQQVIDALANNAAVLKEYSNYYRQWGQAKKELEALLEQKTQFEKEADYNRFQFQELEEAGFKENELESIDEELQLLNNAGDIKAAVEKVYYALEEGEEPIVQQLKSLQAIIGNFAALHPDLASLQKRLLEAQIELKDIAGEINGINNHFQFDPARADELNNRLSAGYKLQKKHGVSSTNELLHIQQQLEEKLQAVLNIDTAITGKQKTVNDNLQHATALAGEISVSRQAQVKPLQDNINKLLKQVGMPNARMQVMVTPAGQLTANGCDAIEFLFDANKSDRFLPLRKVASGGELSRIMLSVKSLVAQHIDLPTLIFDEIDTGISGEAALQVGLIMKKLAQNMQVICITHQPQIAGKADAHYFVYKQPVGNKVNTGIKQLQTSERITAIAQMIGGEKPSAAALENAREMVEGG